MNQVPKAAALPHRFAQLLPAEAGWHFSEQAAEAMPLESEELLSAVQMSPRRLSSFRHGRHCARLAMRGIGEPFRAIPMGKNREPIWPQDLVGSITHSGSSAAAVVAKKHLLAGLGIDLETRGTLRDEIRDLICLPEELTMLKASKHSAVDARVIFSAKESIYKCLWPQLGRYIDFKDVQINLLLQDSSFSIVAAPSLPTSLTTRLRGRFSLASNSVFTVAYL